MGIGEPEGGGRAGVPSRGDPVIPDSLPTYVRRLVFVAPLALYAVILVLPMVSKGLFDALTREDGILEYCQLILLGACCVLSAKQAHSLWKRGAHAWALVYGSFAVVAFLAAGEEISWGQRIFGIETPEWYAEHNLQDETTLHNLDGIHQLQGPVVAGILVILSGLSIWGWSPGRESSMLRRRLYLFIPHPMLLPAWICMITYIVALTVGQRVFAMNGSYYLDRLQEPGELILIGGTAVFLAHVRWLDRLRPSATVTG